MTANPTPIDAVTLATIIELAEDHMRRLTSLPHDEGSRDYKRGLADAGNGILSSLRALSAQSPVTQGGEDGGLTADQLYELVRPIWHYALRKSGDGALFFRSERGQMLWRSCEKIAAALASSQGSLSTRDSLSVEDDENSREAIIGRIGNFYVNDNRQRAFDHALEAAWDAGVASVSPPQSERLIEALREVRADIMNEHGLNSESIVCTVWHGPGETTVDFIDAALTQGTEPLSKVGSGA